MLDEDIGVLDPRDALESPERMRDQRCGDGKRCQGQRRHDRGLAAQRDRRNRSAELQRDGQRGEQLRKGKTEVSKFRHGTIEIEELRHAAEEKRQADPGDEQARRDHAGRPKSQRENTRVSSGMTAQVSAATIRPVTTTLTTSGCQPAAARRRTAAATR